MTERLTVSNLILDALTNPDRRPRKRCLPRRGCGISIRRHNWVGKLITDNPAAARRPGRVAT
jgi:hypothetical protein